MKKWIPIFLALPLWAALLCVPAVAPVPLGRTMQSVVQVVSLRPSGRGSGFFVGPGLVLTASHVVHHTQWPVVAMFPAVVDGEPARLIRHDPELDLALLSVGDMNERRLRFSSPRLGQRVFIIGYTNGEMVVHQGHVADVNHGGRVLIGGAGRPGLSGCPVVDRRGRVVGVLVECTDVFGAPNPTQYRLVPGPLCRRFVQEALR